MPEIPANNLLKIPSSLCPEGNPSITLHLGKIRDSIGMLFGLAMFFLGIWLITLAPVSNEDRMFGLLICLTGALILVGSVVDILAYRLDLSENGIQVNHIRFINCYYYPWSKVSDFRVLNTFLFPMVAFTVAMEDDEDSLETIDHYLYTPFGLSAMDLAGVLNHWKNYYSSNDEHARK